MCALCRKEPCDSRCPNAPEPRVLYACINCGSEIVEGESYYDVDGEPWCEECMRGCLKEAELSE
ncbi:MAG: hypothetical protein Q4C77_04235 [Eubacteriales bacterium]|nr:hypothetical protein [Eubacteriales bacterium]